MLIVSNLKIVFAFACAAKAGAVVIRLSSQCRSSGAIKCSETNSFPAMIKMQDNIGNLNNTQTIENVHVWVFWYSGVQTPRQTIHLKSPLQNQVLAMQRKSVSFKGQVGGVQDVTPLEEQRKVVSHGSSLGLGMQVSSSPSVPCRTSVHTGGKCYSGEGCGTLSTTT